MSVNSPEYLTDLDYAVYKNVVLLLENDGSWKRLAIAVGFSEFELLELESNKRPAELLLAKLENRACPVAVFCAVLESCDLHNVLCLLKDPEPVEITVQPQGAGLENFMMIENGGELKLTCQAVGLPPPQYQWYCSDQELVGKTEPVLKIHPFMYENEGLYRCHVSQEGGDVLLSDMVYVNIVPEPPMLLNQSATRETCRAGSTIKFTVNARGHPKLCYQWYKENQQLDGMTDNTMTLDNVDLHMEGKYRCYIYNPAGEIYSNYITLSVYVAPEDVPDCDVRCVANGKLALLIGNQNYKNMSTLNKATNDVITLSYILKKLGFHILALQNLNLIEMRNAIKKFSELIPAGAYVVFYFAGHGFQIRDKFMLPVDAPKPEEFLQTDALSERELLRSILAANPKVLLELLDMCLKTPDPNNKKIFEESSDLHEYCANNNLIQGYATTSYLGAYERKSDLNGIYVKHLKEYMCLDISIVKILENVAKAIEAEKPSEVQIPYRGTNVTTEFKLRDPVNEIRELNEKFEEISMVPDKQIIRFENTNVEATVVFAPYAEVFLNTLQIIVSNLSGYKIKCQTDAEDIRMTVKTVGENWKITIMNVETFKSEKSFSLYLFSEASNEMLGHAVLDVNKPMIGVLDLWCEPS